jgi:hypothetical protein
MTKNLPSISKMYLEGDFMKVKLFDESHEKDLEMEVNNFLESIAGKKVIDIKYHVAIMYDMKEQIYCYSAMVIYED